MKKIIIQTLIIFMLLPLIGTFNIKEVKALGQNETTCNAFEVDYIENDGSFTNQGCYDDLASAKAKMKENNDFVVRHKDSLSYTKIVAMNSGIAYSYPRNAVNSATLSIYQNYNKTKDSTYAKTYVARHYEMNYVDTTIAQYSDVNSYYPGKIVGWIEVNLNGFHGYTDLENVDLVPSKFLNNVISITLGGNNDVTNEEPYSIICSQNYYSVRVNNNYKELIYNYYMGYGTNGYAESYSFVAGPASSSMVEGVKYYSYNGYEFYTNSTFTDNKITYYNYYEFLPLRSKTNISADTFNAYINNVAYNSSIMTNKGQAFIDAQNTYGINALILFAMACHESGNGTSNIAKAKNNLFGWAAYDTNTSNASSYSSVEVGINKQAGVNLRCYIDIADFRFFSSSLGNKGSGCNVKYASDPYWGMKIAGIAYKVDQLSGGSNGNLTDYDKYSLYLVNSINTPFKASANDSGSTLFTSHAFPPNYQENLIVISLGNDGDYTKVQFTNWIENGNVRNDDNIGSSNYGYYDYDNSVAYIKTNSLTVINYANNNNSTPNNTVVTTKEIFSAVDSITLDNECLNIKGAAFIKGMDNTSISHTITLKNITNSSDYKSFTASTYNYEGISFDDGFTYSNVGFEVNIPLKDLTGGSYYFTITVNNNSNVMSKNLLSYTDAYSNLSTNANNLNYHLTTNSYYSYRLELDVDSLPSQINYQNINKPSVKKSMFAFDSFKLDSNLDFYMYGQGFIYRTNFSDKNSIKYTLYLVNDSNSYIEIAASTVDSSLDYTTLLNSKYDMKYICFEASKNLSGLEKGYYEMILKVENGSYIDFVEMTNPGGSTVPSSVTSNGKTYRFFTSSIRDRLMLEVK